MDKPATLNTWTRLGATKAQAERLLAIPRIPFDDETFAVAIRANRFTNAWPCALAWLDQGYAVVDNGQMFIRSESVGRL